MVVEVSSLFCSTCLASTWRVINDPGHCFVFRAQAHDIVGARAPMGSSCDDMTGLLCLQVAGRAMVWGRWAIRDPNCRWEVLTFPMGASGLNAGGKEGDLIENLWPRYAAPLPPAAFSQPPSDIRSGSENSEGTPLPTHHTTPAKAVYSAANRSSWPMHPSLSLEIDQPGLCLQFPTVCL